MIDPTEPIRRDLLAEINAAPGSRENLEHRHGQVWDTAQLQRDFEVLGYAAPLVAVRRRADGVKGSLMFQGSPRYYFDSSRTAADDLRSLDVRGILPSWTWATAWAVSP